MKKITTLCMSLLIAMTVSADEWTLIKDASTLRAGDQIVLGYAAKGITAAASLTSGSNSYWMDPIASTFSGENLMSIGEGTGVYTLEGSEGAWKFAIEGASGTVYLGTTGAKKLSYKTTATNTWTIAIDAAGGATIKSTESTYGTLYYNSGTTSNRFCIYTGTSGMKPINMYRLYVPERYALVYEGYPYRKIACADPTYEEGTAVTLSAGAPTKENDEFMGWVYGETTYQPGSTFVMPAQDAVLKALWKSESTGFEKVVEAPKATKVVRDGQLIIVRDGMEYNVIGARIK